MSFRIGRLPGVRWRNSLRRAHLSTNCILLGAALSPAGTARSGLGAVKDGSPIRRRPHIGRRRADHASGLSLLECVRDPAGAARDSEDGGESVARDADGVEQQRRHDFDIGRQAPAWLEACNRGCDALLKMRRELQAARPSASCVATPRAAPRRADRCRETRDDRSQRYGRPP